MPASSRRANCASAALNHQLIFRWGLTWWLTLPMLLAAMKAAGSARPAASSSAASAPVQVAGSRWGRVSLANVQAAQKASSWWRARNDSPSLANGPIGSWS